MKRSVAIIGPTPAFVRWAIWHPCDLRPLEERRFIDQCFRTLRGIRAYSVAKAEGRIHDGFCLHPEITMAAVGLNRTAVESPRGFSIDEVLCCVAETQFHLRIQVLSK